jgi:hypothetical protein
MPGSESATAETGDGVAGAGGLIDRIELMELPDEAVAPADFVNDAQPLSSNTADTAAAAAACVDLMATPLASLRPSVDPGVPIRQA